MKELINKGYFKPIGEPGQYQIGANLLGKGKYAAIEKENEALRAENEQIKQPFPEVLKREVGKRTEKLSAEKRKAEAQRQALAKERDEAVRRLDEQKANYLYIFSFCRLPADDGRFADFTPMIVADFSRCADHAVARNEERYRILAHSRTYRTAGTRIVDARSDVSVSGHSAHRNLQQCLPYLHLKLRTFQMQFYLAQSAPVLRENEQGILLYVVECLPEPRTRELPLQRTERLHTVVGELHAANTFRSRGDKDVAERRRGETVIDKKILPAVLVLTGRHALDSDKQVMQPSRTR